MRQIYFVIGNESSGEYLTVIGRTLSFFIRSEGHRERIGRSVRLITASLLPTRTGGTRLVPLFGQSPTHLPVLMTLAGPTFNSRTQLQVFLCAAFSLIASRLEGVTGTSALFHPGTCDSSKIK